jgi:RNA methyltransferase, TrmH family
VTEIGSGRNPRIRAAATLRDRRGRERAGLTLVDGVRELQHALAGGIEIVELFVADPLPTDLETLVADCSSRGAAISRVAPAALGRLAYGDRSEGVVAVVRPPDASLEELDLSAGPLVVVLDGLEKPGNVGASIRSADAAGADALIVANPRTDLFNPNVIRASMGTIFTVPVAVGDGPSVRNWLRGRGIRLIAARVDAPAIHVDTDLTGSVAIVLGSEAEGLGPEWEAPDVVGVRLPMLGTADSLNVSVAGAILLYEARRQRGMPGPRLDR